MRCVQGIVPASNAHMCSMMRSRPWPHGSTDDHRWVVSIHCRHWHVLPLLQRPQKSLAKPSFAFHLGNAKIIVLPRSYTIKVYILPMQRFRYYQKGCLLFLALSAHRLLITSVDRRQRSVPPPNSTYVKGAASHVIAGRSVVVFFHQGLWLDSLRSNGIVSTTARTVRVLKKSVRMECTGGRAPIQPVLPAFE